MGLVTLLAMRRLALLVVLAVVAGACRDDGTAAPDFSVELFDGATFELSEHLETDGRPVFLNFWASWCFPCREEMPDFEALAQVRPEVLFLGVAVEDNAGSARSFAIDELGGTYPTGADDGSVAAAYPYLGLPWSWLIDSDGEVVFEFRGQVRPEDLDAKILSLTAPT